MQTFEDDKGREWTVDVNPWTLGRVKDNTGVLLTALVEDDNAVLRILYNDPVMVGDILWRLCEDQAEDRGVSLKDFSYSIAGDAFGKARDAVVEATVDFFGSQEQRDRVRKVINLTLEVDQEVKKLAETELAETDTKELARKYIDSALSMPQSAG